MNRGTVDGRTSSPRTHPPVRTVRRGPTVPIARRFRRRAVWEVQVVSTELSNALNARIVTEQAKGIVAERAGLDIETANARMRQFARVHDLRVVDVAHGLVNGTLDVT
jgi:AmiR/NasT family two-component response regulator